jgi:hypothetical protein
MSQQSGNQSNSHGRSGKNRRDGGQSSSNSQGGEWVQGGHPAPGSSNQQYEQVFTYQTARLPGQPVHDTSSLPQGIVVNNPNTITYLNATPTVPADVLALEAARRQQASNLHYPAGQAASASYTPGPSYGPSNSYTYGGTNPGLNPFSSNSSGQVASNYVKDGTKLDMSKLPIEAEVAGGPLKLFRCPCINTCIGPGRFEQCKVTSPREDQMIGRLWLVHKVRPQSGIVGYACKNRTSIKCDFMSYSQHALDEHINSGDHIISTDG